MSSIRSPTCGHQSLTSRSAFPALLKSDLQRIQRRHQVAGHAREIPHVVAVERRVKHAAAVGRLINCFPRVVVERRLGIEAFNMTGATQHEVPDHALCSGGKLRLTDNNAIGCGRILIQHCAQSKTGKTHAAIGEESPPRAAGSVTDVCHGSTHARF